MKEDYENYENNPPHSPYIAYAPDSHLTHKPNPTFPSNILFLPLSIVLLVVHLIAALVCACTIVGIPFSYAHLKLASLAVCPFGRDQEGPQGGYENVTTTTTITTESDANILSIPGGGYQSVV